ncbi:MAG: hypothetical protein MJ067_04050 [Oscillospiraceae bacterium]|nr:hypothetical protein [Oscillospiraceae bacterium]
MSDFVMDKDGQFGDMIVQGLPERFTIPSDFNTIYKEWGDRILYIDSSVVPGAFQMNTSWYINAPDFNPLPYHDEHSHDFDELVGFLGSNPEDKEDLGGIIEIGINGELHRLTKSSIIFMPAGMKHLPLRIVELHRPILHFSVSMNPTYYCKRTADGEKKD